MRPEFATEGTNTQKENTFLESEQAGEGTSRYLGIRSMKSDRGQSIEQGQHGKARE